MVKRVIKFLKSSLSCIVHFRARVDSPAMIILNYSSISFSLTDYHRRKCPYDGHPHLLIHTSQFDRELSIDHVHTTP